MAGNILKKEKLSISLINLCFKGNWFSNVSKHTVLENTNKYNVCRSKMANIHSS